LKIAIAGAGITGTYCFRLLKKEGFHVDLFDRPHKTACGINPCAWGTSRGFLELVRAAGLDPEKYVLQRFDSVLMDEVRIAGELMTIDKPALILDLMNGGTAKPAMLNIGDYDRVIDATGFARTYLPPIQDDILLPCAQHLVQTEKPLENSIKLGGIGYAWCFPLGQYGYHVGCGTLAEDPRKWLKQHGWPGDGSPSSAAKTLCSCSGKIRLTGPHDALPFATGGSRDGIWGIGEAIGCVAPLAGDGIVPGMKSVRLLLENWDDPQGYTHAVLKEFDWMKKERAVIDKLLAKSPLGIKDAWVLRKNSKRMGMQVGIKEAILFLKALRPIGSWRPEL
jgi:flavin-dependent dehydrogenase